MLIVAEGRERGRRIERNDTRSGVEGSREGWVGGRGWASWIPMGNIKIVYNVILARGKGGIGITRDLQQELRIHGAHMATTRSEQNIAPPVNSYATSLFFFVTFTGALRSLPVAGTEKI